MITFDHVTKYYKTNIGLNDVSLHIDRGEFVFLVGPSGAGKSTLIKLILKEIDADSGSILVNGREVTKLTSRLIPAHRRNVGIVFQDFRLLEHKTVYENVAFAMEITHQKRREIKERVPAVLGLMGIEEYVKKYPSDHSISASAAPVSNQSPDRVQHSRKSFLLFISLTPAPLVGRRIPQPDIAFSYSNVPDVFPFFSRIC